MYEQSLPQKKQSIDASICYLVALHLVAATLPHSLMLCNISIALMIISWFFSRIYIKEFKYLFKDITSILLISFYLIYLIRGSLQYITGSNIVNATIDLEYKLSLLIFPLIILSGASISKKNRDSIVLTFVFSCLVAVLIDLTEIVSINNSSSQKIGRSEITSLLSIHYPYYGMYIVFCIVTLYLLVKESSYYIKVGYILTGIILVLFLLLISARIALISLFLVICLELLRTFFKRDSKKQVIYYLLIFLFFGVLIVMFIPQLRGRWMNMSDDLSVKFATINCAIELIGSDIKSFLVGYGIGSNIYLLKPCYVNKIFWLENADLNVHNQYLEIALALGVVGLIFFLYLLINLLWKANSEKDYLYIYFLFIFIVSCTTESILERQKGVVFFSFINIILYQHLRSNRKKDTSSNYPL